MRLKHPAHLLLLILLGSIALRVAIVLSLGSLWYDEIISVEISKRPFFQMMPLFSFNNNPPFYFILLRAWGLLFGFSEVAVRMFSVFTGAIGLGVFYVLVRAWFDRTTALVAGLLYGLVPFFVYQDTEARMYSLLFLLSAASLLFSWRLATSKNARTYPAIIGYTLCTVLALYTHLTAVALLIVPVAYAVWYRNDIRRWRSIVLAGGIALLLFAPWLALFFLDKLVLFRKGMLFEGWFFQWPFNIPVMLIAPAAFLFSHTPHLFPSSGVHAVDVVLYGGALAIMLYGIAPVVQGDRRKTDTQALMFCAFLFCIPLFLSSLTINLPVFKYYLVSAIAFIAVAAFGLKRLLQSGRLWDWRVYSVLWLSALMILFQLAVMAHYSDAWSEIGPIARFHGADVTVTDAVSEVAVRHYHAEGDPPIAVIEGASALLSEGSGGDDALYRSMRNNWIRYALGDNAEASEIGDRVQALVEDRDIRRVLFVEWVQNGLLTQVVNNAFRSQGYRCVMSVSPSAFSRQGIIRTLWSREDLPDDVRCELVPYGRPK